jgi:hypothetical protein
MGLARAPLLLLLVMPLLLASLSLPADADLSSAAGAVPVLLSSRSARYSAENSGVFLAGAAAAEHGEPQRQQVAAHVPCACHASCCRPQITAQRHSNMACF